jgi:DNA-binding Lrp family transcriptional regulator
MNVEQVVERVRAEFEEMPGLTLTMTQASRLFGLDEPECRRIVDRLVGADYLRRTESGAVTRAA